MMTSGRNIGTAKTSQQPTTTTMAFEIDISSSLVGEDGMDSILDILPTSSLLSQKLKRGGDGGGDECDINASDTLLRLLRSIAIQARMNCLTPKGAISLFNRLTFWGERERETYC